MPIHYWTCPNPECKASNEDLIPAWDFNRFTLFCQSCDTAYILEYGKKDVLVKKTDKFQQQQIGRGNINTQRRMPLPEL